MRFVLWILNWETLSNGGIQFNFQITFSIDVENFGVTQTLDLKENGRNIAVTDENKLEYVQLVCQVKLTESIKEQVRHYLWLRGAKFLFSFGRSWKVFTT